MGNRKLLLVGGGGHCRSVLDCVLRSGAYDAIGTALLKAHGYEVLECARTRRLLTGPRS